MRSNEHIFQIFFPHIIHSQRFHLFASICHKNSAHFQCYDLDYYRNWNSLQIIIVALSSSPCFPTLYHNSQGGHIRKMDKDLNQMTDKIITWNHAQTNYLKVPQGNFKFKSRMAIRINPVFKFYENIDNLCDCLQLAWYSYILCSFVIRFYLSSHIFNKQANNCDFVFFGSNKKCGKNDGMRNR